MNALPQDGLPTPRRYLAMATVFCAVALSVTSITSVSVALPVIAAELAVDASAAIAIVNLFQLVLVATLLPFAALGERYGYRRIFQIGLVLMGFASLGCALAADLLCGQTLGSTLAAMSFQLIPHTAPHGTLLLAATLAGCAATVSLGRSQSARSISQEHP